MSQTTSRPLQNTPFGDFLGSFLTFRRMIIQVLFWIGAAVILISGLMGLLTSLRTMFSSSVVMGIVALLGNAAFVLLGLLVLRVYCELVILLFRMHETLRDIRELSGGSPSAQGDAADHTVSNER